MIISYFTYVHILFFVLEKTKKSQKVTYIIIIISYELSRL